ncbi:MAG: tryptophan synthase subunit alpha [Planctomycetia bacterium]|nr:tryptophan synthase subunit alpha [Planctomycetia bacterium]
MKNRFSETFCRLRNQNRAALVGFITGGDPDADMSRRIVRSMCEGGCDILELGVPFSDPSADGAVIQRSSVRALKNGASLRRVMELAGDVRKDFPEMPVVIFSYYNPILKYGVERFSEEMKKFQVDGVLCVDLPVEESEELTLIMTQKMIRLLAPTTSEERVRKIVEAAEGFLYIISSMGVTGSRRLDFKRITERVSVIRQILSEKKRQDVPVCVGFGISSVAEVKEIAKIADGVIIGSAFERILEKALSEGRDPVLEIKKYTQEVSMACFRR